MKCHEVFQIFKFKSENQTLQCDHSNESYWAVLSCNTVHYAVQGGSNFKVCGWNHSNETMTIQMKADEQYFHVVLQLFVFQIFHKRIFFWHLKSSKLSRGKSSAAVHKGSMVYSLVSTEDLCVSCWFCLKTAPGLGYGLIWNKGPLAVVSTPVLASPFLSKPVVHVPLWKKRYSYWLSGLNLVRFVRERRLRVKSLPLSTWVDSATHDWLFLTLSGFLRQGGGGGDQTITLKRDYPWNNNFMNRGSIW